MSLEVIQKDGIKYAEIIWADTKVEKTRFFSPPESSFQFGIVAHGAGYQEEPHFHKAVERTISDLQQMMVIQSGVLTNGRLEAFRTAGRLDLAAVVALSAPGRARLGLP